MSKSKPSIQLRIRTHVRTRRDVFALMRQLGEHMGAAARDPANLTARPCPVCGVNAVTQISGPPRPVVRGPVYEFVPCSGCTLLFAPRLLRPDVMRRLYGERPIYRAYWEHMRADAEAMKGSDAYRPLVEKLLRASSGRGAAIDVGCGFGKLTAELAPHFGEVIGLESNRRTAREGARIFGITIRPGRLEQLERAPGSVDLIVLNQVLEHLSDVRSVLAAAHRLLRPGGVLWIGIPHGASIGMRMLRGTHPFLSTHMHLNMFNARALRTLVTTAGFTLRHLGTDDVLDLSASDWVIDRVPADLPLLAAPALALDQLARRVARTTALLSRLGAGAHLEATVTADAEPAP